MEYGKIDMITVNLVEWMEFMFYKYKYEFIALCPSTINWMVCLWSGN